MTQSNFKDICILSGTDYNIHANTKKSRSKNSNRNSDMLLYDTLKLFQKYKDEMRNTNTDVTFYNWLQNNTDCISDLELLVKINNMFDLSVDHSSIENFKYIKIINGPVNNNVLHEIMRKDGFIFIT
jgi:hypothetical protein